jgi:hypothetical protein
MEMERRCADISTSGLKFGLHPAKRSCQSLYVINHNDIPLEFLCEEVKRTIFYVI